MRFVWTTDPHLNHVPLGTWERWIAEIRNQQADGLLLTGDISEGDDVTFELRRLAETLEQPVFFVLGNHDFYQSSIAQTRQRVIELCRDHPLLTYLTDCEPIRVGQSSYLAGDDGWGDATVGDYKRSPIRLNDFELIHDFQGLDIETRVGILRREGQASADRLEQKLLSLREARHVLAITHVPPFRQACWYQGRTTDDLWAPYFVCGNVGAALERVCRSNARTQFTTLCGHTHHGGLAVLADNHRVFTGAAEYGEPTIEGMVTITDEGIEVQINPQGPPTS